MEINKKSGISLIVLVITIIVMIILAAAIILSLTNSGIIGKAREAMIKSDIKSMQEELNIKMAEMELNGENIDTLNDKDLAEVIKIAKKYEGKFTISYGKLYISPSATEEEIKCAKELGIELNDLYIYDMLAFDYAESSMGTSAYNIGSKGKLTVTLPENNDIEWFYKNSEQDEFTILTNDFQNDEWQHMMNYYTGEKVDSTMYIGYRKKGESKINSKKFSFWQLVAPGVIVDVNETNGELKIDTGKIPMEKYDKYAIVVYDGSSKKLDEFDARYYCEIIKTEETYKNIPLLSKDMASMGDLYYVQVVLFHNGDTIDNGGYRTIAGFYVEKDKSGTKRLNKWKEEKMVWTITYNGQKTPIYTRYMTFNGKISTIVDFFGKEGTKFTYDEMTYAINNGWYYDKEFKNKAKEGDDLTKVKSDGNDINVYSKVDGFSEPYYTSEITNISSTATGVLGKIYITFQNLKDIKIVSYHDGWNLSADGKKVYHPKYGTTDEEGVWGAYIELIEDEGGVAITYNFDGEGKFSDAITGVWCMLSGTYTKDDGTDMTLYTQAGWPGYVPVVK